MDERNVLCIKSSAVRAFTAMCLGIALAACNGPETTGQSGTEGNAADCMEQTGTSPAPPNESSPLGVPTRVASAIDQPLEHTISYRPKPDAEPVKTTLTLVATTDPASATLKHWATKGNDRTICPDTLEMPTTAALSTSDSAFSAVFKGTTTVTASRKMFVASISRDALNGTYDSSWLPGDGIQLVVEFTDEGSTGTLSGSSTKTGDTEVGSAELLSW